MNIYVSNLSFNTGDAELSDLFSAYGTVTSVKVITDRETGRSRGFGFVEMPSTEEGQKAISALNNKEVEGRAMSVAEAREKTERSSGKSFNRNFNGGNSGYKKW